MKKSSIAYGAISLLCLVIAARGSDRPTNGDVWEVEVLRDDPYALVETQRGDGTKVAWIGWPVRRFRPNEVEQTAILVPPAVGFALQKVAKGEQPMNVGESWTKEANGLKWILYRPDATHLGTIPPPELTGRPKNPKAKAPVEDKSDRRWVWPYGIDGVSQCVDPDGRLFIMSIPDPEHKLLRPGIMWARSEDDDAWHWFAPYEARVIDGLVEKVSGSAERHQKERRVATETVALTVVGLVAFFSLGVWGSSLLC